MPLRLRTDDGFTLLEVLVVVLILGILMAVAAPTFLSQGKKAKDAHAIQSLGFALKAAQSASVGNDGKFKEVDGTLDGANSLADDIANENVYSFHDVEGGSRAAGGTRSVSPGPDDVVVDSASTPDRLILFNSSDLPNGHPANQIRECTMIVNGFGGKPQISCVDTQASYSYDPDTGTYSP